MPFDQKSTLNTKPYKGLKTKKGTRYNMQTLTNKNKNNKTKNYGGYIKVLLPQK